MLLGVVSDTHNRISNVEKIVEIFNSNKVDLVIHTGDITQAKILDIFCGLKSSLLGVFGNNDLNEPGLEESVKRNGFKFSLPPLITSITTKSNLPPSSAGIGSMLNIDKLTLRKAAKGIKELSPARFTISRVPFTIPTGPDPGNGLSPSAQDQIDFQVMDSIVPISWNAIGIADQIG